MQKGTKNTVIFHQKSGLFADNKEKLVVERHDLLYPEGTRPLQTWQTHLSNAFATQIKKLTRKIVFIFVIQSWKQNYAEDKENSNLTSLLKSHRKKESTESHECLCLVRLWHFQKNEGPMLLKYTIYSLYISENVARKFILKRLPISFD